MSTNGAPSASPNHEGNTSDAAPGSKRKNPDGSDAPPTQQRAKRNRYISIACNECKRRKIKCNGQTPCQRCGNLQLECLYAPNCCNNFKDSEEFKRMDAHIQALQDQVDTLFNNLNSLRNHVDASVLGSDPSPFPDNQYARSMSISQASAQGPQSNGRTKQPHQQQQPKHPRFHGPTSNAFNLGVAKANLQSIGITATDEGAEEGVFTQDATPLDSPRLAPLAPPPSQHTNKPVLHTTKDPMWAINKDEAIRLCHVWHEEMGLMYPVLDIEATIRHATLLYTFMEAAHRTRLVEVSFPGADSISDDQTIILKLVLATALILEGSGKSELGTAMFQSIRPNVEAVLLASVNVRGIKMLTLTAMYHFHRDEEDTAWRIIGLAARLCMELGLHRRETYSTIFTEEEERAAAIRLFWSVYVLDRRWSFGTGMPFAFEDTDIDPNVPKPDDATPYLNCMVTYSNIGSRVWKSVANSDNAPISKEEIGYLDYQIIQWHRSIPPALKYLHPSSSNPQDQQPVTRSIHRFRILLYLRANQMRILIYRPVLHTTSSIMEDMTAAQTVVDVAKDTINVLTHTNQTTDIYRSHQVMFNYFLISALAVLLLAVSHAPAQFSECCRDEFYMALDLVRGLSANSYVSKRLWRTIKVLKEVGPKLGLNLRGGNHAAVDASDAHSNRSTNGGGQGQGSVAGTGGGGRASESPNGMANDLTSLFEAAGGFAASTGFAPQNGYLMSASGGEGGPQAGAEIVNAVFGHDDELARILRDLF
ncbi:Casein kinase II regulatory subunit [Lasiodiplodia theobromae]|nr:Casein kinase II regulatory subunit [Lasiodiplodia theobromae]